LRDFLLVSALLTSTIAFPSLSRIHPSPVQPFWKNHDFSKHRYFVLLPFFFVWARPWPVVRLWPVVLGVSQSATEAKS
jgi:hypothetical protein